MKITANSISKFDLLVFTEVFPFFKLFLVGTLLKWLTISYYIFLWRSFVKVIKNTYILSIWDSSYQANLVYVNMDQNRQLLIIVVAANYNKITSSNYFGAIFDLTYNQFCSSTFLHRCGLSIMSWVEVDCSMDTSNSWNLLTALQICCYRAIH